MPIFPDPKDQWFVVHVLPGQELKVKENIMRRVQAEEMADYIFEVLVPQEKVSEVKAGAKREVNRKFFPGYVIINMYLYDKDQKLMGDSWYFIQETDGVITFAGTKEKPVPMRMSEVDGMLAQIKEREGSVKPAVEHEIGDSVTVADGPFQGQNGIIAEIDEEKGELMVSVNIFGRETLVPLEYWQVDREQ